MFALPEPAVTVLPLPKSATVRRTGAAGDRVVVAGAGDVDRLAAGAAGDRVAVAEDVDGDVAAARVDRVVAAIHVDQRAADTAIRGVAGSVQVQRDSAAAARDGLVRAVGVDYVTAGAIVGNRVSATDQVDRGAARAEDGETLVAGGQGRRIANGPDKNLEVERWRRRGCQRHATVGVEPHGNAIHAGRVKRRISARVEL